MAAGERHVIVVADGAVDAAHLAALVEGAPGLDPALDPRPFVIAADGGAGKTLVAGVRPDLVIGDGDSLRAGERAHLESTGIRLVLADPDKDESDTELCLLAALGEAPDRISLLGALGEARPEHSVANLLLLADPRFDGIRFEILTPGSRLTRIGTAAGPGELVLEGMAGDWVSLFALDPAVTGVETEGLRFALRCETLTMGPARGLSNEMTDQRAHVRTRTGRLLVVHTTRGDPDDDPNDGSTGG
jgi:thiamine pyrophosphokinase